MLNKMSKVFISAPISVDWSTVMEFASVVKEAGGNPQYWVRDTSYNQREFDASNSVVFILPGNAWEKSQHGLPKGLKSELSRAYASGKNIYIGYITSRGEHNIYCADSNGMDIKGIQGSSSAFEEQMTANRYAERVMVNSTYGAWGKNSCSEIELPLPKGPTGFSGRPGIAGVDGIEFDERLLLMM